MAGCFILIFAAIQYKSHIKWAILITISPADLSTGILLHYYSHNESLCHNKTTINTELISLCFHGDVT